LLICLGRQAEMTEMSDSAKNETAKGDAGELAKLYFRYL
jgi:hypothetical protein